jgi:raffinose/stachyose/melibiose transport system substrate-binding protein
MKLTKKAVLLFFGMILAAGSLFAGGGGQDKGAAGGSGTTTINFWHINTGDNRRIPLENAAKRFEAANPGVKIQIEVYANDAYKTKLKTVSGDDFPDVFHSWGGGWLKSFIDAGLVADITNDVKGLAPQIGQNNLDFAKYGATTYGIPYIGGSTVFYYNKDLFAKYNLQFPKTLAELDNVCKVFIANGITPFTVANRSKWPGAQYFVLLSMRLGGADIFQQAMDKKVKFTDPTFIRAGEILQTQIANGYFPAGANGLNSDQGQDRMMFYQEQAAMMIMTSGTISSIADENKEFFNSKLAIGLYPAIDGGKGKVTDLLAGNNVLSVSANCKNKAIAAKFAAFIATDKQLQTEFMETGSIPILQGLTANNPISQELLREVAAATYLQNYIDQTLSAELAELHKDTVQALFGNTMTPRQAAEEMQKAYDAAN